MHRSYGFAVLWLIAQAASGCASGPYVSSRAITPGGDGTYYALPRAYAPLKIERKHGKLTVTPTTPLLYFPDPKYAFRLNLEHSWITTDHIAVGTTETGLLTSINGSSTDQTAAAVSQAIQLASEIVKTGAAFGSPGVATAGGPPKPDEAKDFEFEVALDPTDVKSDRWAEVSAYLANYGVAVTAQPLNGGPTAFENEQALQAQSATCSDSICFRPARPYEIVFRQTARTLPPVAFRFLIVAPDPAMLLSIRLDRQILATSGIKLTFCNGMLTNYETTKHSEVTSLLQVPIDALKMIAEIPGSVLSVRIQNDQQNANLLQGQTNLLNAQAAFVAAQAQAAARKAQPESPTEP